MSTLSSFSAWVGLFWSDWMHKTIVWWRLVSAAPWVDEEGGYNSVQRYGTTIGNAYWALAMQKYRFVAMSLRGSEFVHQPNTIVGKCNTRLVLNSTPISTTCTREICCLSFMTQDHKMWSVNFKMPVWWPKI
jgi:hypothetical protein